jgi:hypothetical protein
VYFYLIIVTLLRGERRGVSDNRGEPDASLPAHGCAGVCDDVDAEASTKGTYTRDHGERIRRGSAGRMRSAAEWAECAYRRGKRPKT